MQLRRKNKVGPNYYKFSQEKNKFPAPLSYAFVVPKQVYPRFTRNIK
jgi:hypothetical protein